MSQPPESLKKKIKLFPHKPGIYLFKNREGDIIYIGKAHSLKERVSSYFQTTSDVKVKNILAETEDVDFILTGSNQEAAFLENNFIRRYQPKFNLRLKDDKTFPYLKLTVDETFPGIYFTRKIEDDKSRYFGPFFLAHQARKSIQLINRYFGIRGCEEPIPGRRKRPCLEYELKLCLAPCVGYISEAEYRENIRNTILFLEGKTEKLLKILRKKMMEAASLEKFEEAAHWRDLIQTIEHMREKPKLISPRKENKDIFGFFREKEKIAIYAFLMRGGRVIESKEFFFEAKTNSSDEDVFSSLLQNFYMKCGDFPDKILLPFPLEKKDTVEKKLSSLAAKKVEITFPLKGKNKQLVRLARKNAWLFLQKKEGALSPLLKLKEILRLPSLPERIEGFDISNTGGRESVGSLVVFEDGMPDKEEYRKYIIRTVTGPDDVASLKEVITRRYRKLIEEKKKLPDLILVDGGKGQLSAAREALGKLGLENLPLVSLAKKEEIIFSPSRKNGIKLDRTSPALKLLQSIRDEAHRFALSFHRLRRAKKASESLIDGIEGIGKKRKLMLLRTYRSIEEMRKASEEELASLVGKKAALALKEKLGP